jgi:hypothetical protein
MRCILNTKEISFELKVQNNGDKWDLMILDGVNLVLLLIPHIISRV